MAERQTLLLLCGIGEDEAVWVEVAEALANVAEIHPIIPDGDSVEAMAADILAQFDGPLAVAGHSLGGYVALAMQRAAPARVERIALLNSSARPDDRQARIARQALIDRVGRDGFETVVALLARTLAALPTAINPAAMLLRNGEARFVRQQRAAMARPDARPGLYGVAIPMLVMGAGRDRIVPHDRSAEIAAIVPGARLILLPESGHLSPIEASAAVAAAMRAWLAVQACALPHGSPKTCHIHLEETAHDRRYRPDIL